MGLRRSAVEDAYCMLLRRSGDASQPVNLWGVNHGLTSTWARTITPLSLVSTSLFVFLPV